MGARGRETWRNDWGFVFAMLGSFVSEARFGFNNALPRRRASVVVWSVEICGKCQDLFESRRARLFDSDKIGGHVAGRAFCFPLTSLLHRPSSSHLLQTTSFVLWSNSIVILAFLLNDNLIYRKPLGDFSWYILETQISPRISDISSRIVLSLPPCLLITPPPNNYTYIRVICVLTGNEVGYFPS